MIDLSPELEAKLPQTIQEIRAYWRRKETSEPGSSLVANRTLVDADGSKGGMDGTVQAFDGRR